MDRALEMQVFCTVVEKGSFIAAVEPLNMSKAAVSRHVNALEARLGARLLHRTTRRLSLTEEGRALAAKCKERHRIVFDFLHCIGVPDDIAETDAEGIEHHVSAETLMIFQSFVQKNKK